MAKLACHDCGAHGGNVESGLTRSDPTYILQGALQGVKSKKNT